MKTKTFGVLFAFIVGVSLASVHAADTLSASKSLDDVSRNLSMTYTPVDTPSGLAYNFSHVLDMGTQKSDALSAVTTFSSVTFSAVTATSATVPLNGSNIEASAHGLTTGLPVLFSAGAGTAPLPLVTQTTYYAYPVSADLLGLALTSTGAIAGDLIVFVSSTSGNNETYTITPLAITGNPTFAWTVSNDGVDYTNFTTAVSSTISGGYTAGGVSYPLNFTDMNYRYLKYSITAPTAGAIDVKTVIHVKMKD